MHTNICIHLEVGTQVGINVTEKYTALNLDDITSCHSLFFKSEDHLRNFAESILQQLEKKEEVSV